MNNSQISLSGKKIIVIGGAGLLGRPVCKSIVTSNATCVIADLSLSSAEELAFEIKNESGICLDCIEVSITNPRSIENMIKIAHEKLGHIDCLINMAYPRNKQYGRKFEDVEYLDFCENVNLHLGGYFLVSQKILEYFKQNNGGNLLNISSIYGVVAPRFEIYKGTSMTMPVEYAAIKAAIIHLTRYMAKYYSGNNIRVNALSIGGLLDKQPESFLSAYREQCLDKGMLDPMDISGTIAFLLSDASRFINGQNICIDDGFTI